MLLLKIAGRFRQLRDKALTSLRRVESWAETCVSYFYNGHIYMVDPDKLFIRIKPVFYFNNTPLIGEFFMFFVVC